MNILQLTMNILNDVNVLKYYSATTFYMTDFDFLDILDKRNGEIYSFYKEKNNKNWIYFESHQEHSLYSMDKGKTEHGLFGNTVLRIDSYKNRPINPFEKLGEYEIKISNNYNIENIKFLE